MRKRKKWSLLRFLLVYFAGAISMLLFLVPGKIKLKDVFDGEKLSAMADFNHAADKVENANDRATYYAHQAWYYLRDKVD